MFVDRVGFLVLVSIWTLKILLDLTFQSNLVLCINLQFLIRWLDIRNCFLFWLFFLQLRAIVGLSIWVRIFLFLEAFVLEIVLMPEIDRDLVLDHVIDRWAWDTWGSFNQANLITFTIGLIKEISGPLPWTLAQTFPQWRIPVQLTVHFELYVTWSYQEPTKMHLNKNVITLTHEMSSELEYHVNYSLSDLRWAVACCICYSLPI